MAKARGSDAPDCGREAFAQGWDVDCHCPHEPDTVEAMMWHSDWWRANAEAFASHIGQDPPPPKLPAIKACKKCQDRGEAITKLATFCDIYSPGYPDLYAVRHWCDSYSSAEAKRYMHGYIGFIGPTNLSKTKEEAIQAWNLLN